MEGPGKAQSPTIGGDVESEDRRHGEDPLEWGSSACGEGGKRVRVTWITGVEGGRKKIVQGRGGGGFEGGGATAVLGTVPRSSVTRTATDSRASLDAGLQLR